MASFESHPWSDTCKKTWEKSLRSESISQTQKLTRFTAAVGEVKPAPNRRPAKPFMDATVIGLQHAKHLAEQSARAYQVVQGLRPPTVAVYQATR